MEVGGGSVDVSFLRKGQPIRSGPYAIGAIRLRQILASWQGSHDQGMRLLRRHIHNVVDDMRRDMPLREAQHFIALGGDVRFAADLLLGGKAVATGPRVLPKEPFLAFCDHVTAFDVDQLVTAFHCSPLCTSHLN